MISLARRRRLHGASLARALASFALACLALIALATLAASAHAEACAGVGPTAPCPYSSAQIIGQRGEGVLRFPEAVAGGASEPGGGWEGGAPGRCAPIGGRAADAAGNVYVVASSHNRIEKFNSEG